MSMSVPGEIRSPSEKLSVKAVAADGNKPSQATPAKAGAAKTAGGGGGAAKTGGGGAGKGAGAKSGIAGRGAPARPGAKAQPRGAGGKGRKPIVVVNVAKARNWGPISMFVGACMVAILIIGFGGYQVWRQGHQPSWQDRAAAIKGIHNYLKTNPDWFVVPASGNHKSGPLTYPIYPPVGGTHNPTWQNCMGNVYTSEIAKEQATHSMEHGAVWITYRPDLPKDQVATLAKKVDGRTFMLMSPYPGLDAPISLQAWGYQLKVANAGDGRIDDFISALRTNATQEPQAGCSGGITDATPLPLDIPPQTGGTP